MVNNKRPAAPGAGGGPGGTGERAERATPSAPNFSTPQAQVQAIRAALRCSRRGCACQGERGNVHCPAHADQTPSLAVTVRDGRVLVHCYAGCAQEAVIAVLRERGLWPQAAPQAGGLTVERLAQAKRLPMEFLQGLGLEDDRRNGSAVVRIPYMDETGNEVAVRLRCALEGPLRFRWRRGDHPMPYGLWRLDEARRHGWVLIVEGESDCWTAWLHGLPAIGLPGKGVWRPDWAAYLVGLDAFVWQEPGAEDFPRRIGGNVPNVRVLIAPDGFKDISEAHLAGVDVPGLVARLRREAVPVADRVRADLEREAAPVLEADDPLGLVAEALRGLGYGGDLKPALIAYLCLTTRLLAMRPGAMPAHLLIVGPPSAGKSFTLRSVLALFPPSAIHTIDAGSPRVLIYDDADLRHRAVIFSESDSLPAGEDNPAASAIRALLQDHRLHYQVTIRDPQTGEFAVKEIDRPGPTVLVTTATRPLAGQLGSRVFTLAVPEDGAQIRAALAAQARAEVHGTAVPDRALVAFQELLQSRAPFEAVVPFAPALAELIGRGVAAARVQRDFQRLLSLIKAVAILRQGRRERNADGRIVASLEDYATVYDLVAEMYTASVSGANAGVRRVVEAVADLRQKGGGARVSYSAVAKHLGLHPEQVKRWAGMAIRGGWLVNHADRHHPADLDIGDPLPPATGLPTPTELSADHKDRGISIGSTCESVKSPTLDFTLSHPLPIDENNNPGSDWEEGWV